MMQYVNIVNILIITLVILVCHGKKVELEKCSNTCPNITSSQYRDILIQQQHVIHCTESNHDTDSCLKYWNSTTMRYEVYFREHYERLRVNVNHSVNTVNKNAAWKETAYHLHELDLLVDARCHHSWTINPYHRIADCMVLILPALYNYLLDEISRPSFRSRPQKVVLLVDESTEALCNPASNSKSVNKLVLVKDTCLLSFFYELLRSRLLYKCISTSTYFASNNWFRRRNNLGASVRQFVWLDEQKNAFTYGSGFDTVASHPNYNLYLNEFQRLLLHGFQCQCSFEDDVDDIGRRAQASLRLKNNSKESFDSHNLIVVIERPEMSGRYIPQHIDMIDAIERSIAKLNSDIGLRMGAQFDDSSFDLFKLVRYTGKESLCDTIALFWSAKVIIGAHGAGIINTAFSRPDSLLIEITPDKLNPEARGEPWRMNALFAQRNGLSTQVIVVRHNPEAITERDLQTIYPLDISPYHIQFVQQAVQDFLMNEPLVKKYLHPQDERPTGLINEPSVSDRAEFPRLPQFNRITSLVDY